MATGKDRELALVLAHTLNALLKLHSFTFMVMWQLQDKIEDVEKLVGESNDVTAEMQEALDALGKYTSDE